MEFSYQGYAKLINQLIDSGYKITDYQNWKYYSRCVILRHDIDYELSKAVKMARLENTMGIASTYFVLVSSDFYNVYSRNSIKDISEIIKCGHEIGLHFDELRYPELKGNLNEIKEKIIEECSLLSLASGAKVKVISMHRPSKMILDSDLKIPGMINSYGSAFFREFKYLSDSRRVWREPVEDIIQSQKYNRLHILTHAFWYNEEEQNLAESLLSFINSGNNDRFKCLKDNFSRLDEEISFPLYLEREAQDGY